MIKKADKGTTTVIMNRTDKLNEGQVQIDDIHNCRPLDNPMVGTTAKKVHRLIQSLLQEGHIDDMTAKWLSLTPEPRAVFYTLTKIYKPTPVGRPIISGFDVPTERISFPKSLFCGALSEYSFFCSGHKYVSKSHGHFRPNGCSVNLEVIFSIELERVFL